MDLKEFAKVALGEALMGKARHALMRRVIKHKSLAAKAPLSRETAFANKNAKRGFTQLEKLLKRNK